MSESYRGLALIVDDDKVNRMVLQALLLKNGFDILMAENGQEAINVFNENDIDIIFMDVMMPIMDGYQSTKIIKSLCDENNIFVPIIFLTALTDENSLSKCVEAGGDDFISKPYNITILNSKIQAMERVRDLSRKMLAMYARLQNDEEIAEKFFSDAVHSKNILNSDLTNILKSADIFSGDMFISAYTPSRNINALLGDFTGHGIASALGALPVSEIFHAMTEKGYSIHEIIKTINAKLCKLLPVGMFMACQLVSVDNKLKNISIYNCGMPPIYIKSGSGVKSVPSNIFPLGISADVDFSQCVQYLETNINDRVILSSDGVTEACNNDGEEFGDQRLFEIISKHSNSDSFIISEVDKELSDFCRDSEQLDDISIAEIRLRTSLLPSWNIATITEERINDIEIKSLIENNESSAQFIVSAQGENINKIDPIPQIVTNINNIIGNEEHSQSLFTILTELYVNAVDHGLLELDSNLKNSPEGFSLYFKDREKKLKSLTNESIEITISIKENPDSYVVVIRIEDSGKGFNIDALNLNNNDTVDIKAFGRGVSLVKNLCETLYYELPGNIVEAIYICNR